MVVSRRQLSSPELLTVLARTMEPAPSRHGGFRTAVAQTDFDRPRSGALSAPERM
jgi:hypothetical protein